VSNRGVIIGGLLLSCLVGLSACDGGKYGDVDNSSPPTALVTIVVAPTSIAHRKNTKLLQLCWASCLSTGVHSKTSAARNRSCLPTELMLAPCAPQFVA
jgi:hypothetical protein